MITEPTPPETAHAPDAFARWAATAEAVRATTKRLEKLAALQAYFATLADDASLATAARFFAGLPFPRHDARTTQVGGSAVRDALLALSGTDAETLHARYVALGDAGDLAAELLADHAPSGATLADVVALFDALAAAGGSTRRRALVREALAGLGPLEAKYVVKLALGSGELRIGLKEAQVEEALGRAFGRPLAEVRRANLLRGDVGEVAVLARADALGDARLALFHPIGFMLAQPLATAEEIVAALPSPFAVEAKYDGIRGQAHVGADDAGARRVALFSRTLDDITAGSPAVAAALAALPAGTVLDGELLAVDPARPARALPFKDLQSRLGRKAPDAELLARVPVAFVAYDVLAADGALVLDEPYAARRGRVLRMIGDAGGEAATLRAAPVREARTSADVEAAFADARAAGEEGIIAKDPASPYTPGRRGKTWIKLKKALATLDVVIVGAEWGHGRRRSVLSDYTFAVRRSADDPTLLTVGKAYNGLTDVEIAALTERLRALTEQRFGRYHAVRPEIVLEVTFDVVQASARHKAGYALRFPRIVRVRDDKPASEIDTLARVRELAGEQSDQRGAIDDER